MAQTELARLVIRLEADNARLRRDLQTTNRIAKQSADRVSTAGRQIANVYRVLVAGAAAIAVKRTFELGAAVEETASKFRTVLGAEAKRVSEELETFATNAGLSRREAQDLVATTAAMAQGMGLARDESADFAIDLARLAGDLSSFNNLPIAETSRAIQAAIAGERESLKRMGIVVLETDVQKRALIETGKKSADQLTQEEKALATLALVTERAGVAVGDLERTQLSAANTARRVNARMKNLRDTFAKEFLPTMAQVVGAADDAGGGFQKLEDFIKTAFGRVREFTAGLQIMAAELPVLVARFELWRAKQKGTVAEVVDATQNLIRMEDAAEQVKFEIVETTDALNNMAENLNTTRDETENQTDAFIELAEAMERVNRAQLTPFDPSGFGGMFFDEGDRERQRRNRDRASQLQIATTLIAQEGRIQAERMGEAIIEGSESGADTFIGGIRGPLDQLFAGFTSFDSIGQGIGQFIGQAATGLLGNALGAAFGAIGGLFGESEAERRERAERRHNAEVMAELSQNIEELSARIQELPGSQVSELQELVTQLSQIRFGSDRLAPRDLIGLVSGSGLTDKTLAGGLDASLSSALRDAAEFLGLQLGEVIDLEEIEQVLEGLAQVLEEAAADVERAFGEDLAIREAQLAGDDMAATRLRLEAANAAELAAAEELVEGGLLTQEMFERLEDVLAGELAQALAEVAEQAEAAAEAQRREAEAFRLGIEAREAALSGDIAGATAARFEAQAASELQAARDLLEAGTITEELFKRLAAVLDAELAQALAEIAEQAARTARAFGADLGIRRATLRGDDAEAERLRRQLAAAEELNAAEKLLEAGTITEAMFDDLADLLSDELAQALADIADAAREATEALENDIRVRELSVRGLDDEAAKLRLRLRQEKELTDAIASGATEELVARLEQLQAAEFRALLESLAPGVPSSAIGVDAGGLGAGSGSRINRVAGISETTATRLSDINFSILSQSRQQTTLLRSIDRRLSGRGGLSLDEQLGVTVALEEAASGVARVEL